MYNPTLEFKPTGGCPPACTTRSCTATVRFSGITFSVGGKCENKDNRRRALLQDASDSVAEPVVDDAAAVAALGLPTDESGVVTALPTNEVVELFNPEDGSWVSVSTALPTDGRRLHTLSSVFCDIPGGVYVRSPRNCPSGDCGKCCVRVF
jgi:hypothetical protein